MAVRGEDWSLVETTRVLETSLGKQRHGRQPRSHWKIIALTMPSQRKKRDEEGKEDEGSGAGRSGCFVGGDEAVTGVVKCRCSHRDVAGMRESDGRWDDVFLLS
ncbi:hypothetical protein SLE2022_296580 [Rubroshorea leprosula]